MAFDETINFSYGSKPHFTAVIGKSRQTVACNRATEFLLFLWLTGGSVGFHKAVYKALQRGDLIGLTF